MGKKKKTPKPPDYVALAKQQAELDKAATDRQTLSNRVDQYTPTGSLTWKDMGNGRWEQHETYTPEAQAALESQQRVQQGLAETGEGLLGGVNEAVKDPFSMEGMTQVKGFNPAAMPTTEGLGDRRSIDESQLGAYGNLDLSNLGDLPDAGFGAVKEVQEAMMSRLRPGLERGREAENARLRAQGLTEGSRARQTATTLQDQRANDAEQQALLGAAGEYGNIYNRSLQGRQQQVAEQAMAAEYANALRGQQFGEQGELADRANANRAAELEDRFRMYDTENSRQMMERGASEDDRAREVQEALMLRQMPLNELSAFMSGSQVQNPTFEGYNQGGLAQAANIYGASKDKYAAQKEYVAAKNAARAGKIGGLATLAGGVAGSFFGMPQLGASLGGALGGMAAG
jgi:hypothetical protein